MSHVAWPSIESFAHVRKGVEAYGQNVGPTSIAHRQAITYKGKIKLHGTNAGVTIKNHGKDVFAQSRTSIVTPGDDNMGFAVWVEATKDYWVDLGVMLGDDPITVFGEWSGQGIQKGVSISQIGKKIFAVFAIQFGEDRVCIDPSLISLALSVPSAVGLPENIHVLPWYDFSEDSTVTIDYTDVDTMRSEMDRVTILVEAIDSCDPWVRATFEVDGPGEGLVWYPVSLADENGDALRENLSRYMFKTKGEKHKVVKTKKELIPIDPEVVENITGFVDTFVTEARLEQGVREVARGELAFEARLIGPFIGWIGKDVSKESAVELEAAGLEWKDVSKSVTTAARNWYLKKIEES